jgi:hypothetical protein
MTTFNPKCLNGKELGYSVTGHITPCCWTNISWYWDKNNPQLAKLFSPELHIDNNKTVEDILNSEPWRNFFDMLKNNPDLAPFNCRKNCSRLMNEDPEESTPKEWYDND